MLISNLEDNNACVISNMTVGVSMKHCVHAEKLCQGTEVFSNVVLLYDLFGSHSIIV